MRNDVVRFMLQFARHPRAIGAITPSSEALAQRIVAPVPLSGDPVVVELGPGTGVFTEAIRRRLGGRGRQIAIEINPILAGLLATRVSTVDVVLGDADTVDRVLAERGYAAADAVISGLPWSLFPPSAQTRTLDAIAAVLAPSGAFSTFAYLHALWTPAARRFRRELAERFEEVTITRATWANLPPATVYHCRRPIRAPLPVAAAEMTA